MDALVGRAARLAALVGAARSEARHLAATHDSLEGIAQRSAAMNAAARLRSASLHQHGWHVENGHQGRLDWTLSANLLGCPCTPDGLRGRPSHRFTHRECVPGAGGGGAFGPRWVLRLPLRLGAACALFGRGRATALNSGSRLCCPKDCVKI